MAMKRCAAGLHFYDESKNDSCPYCRDSEMLSPGGPAVSSPTVGTIGDEPTIGIDPDSPLSPARNSGKMDQGATTVGQAHLDPEGHTRAIGIYGDKPESGQDGFMPVVGWLVCTDGPERGKDYRIKPGYNWVGKDPSMNIVMPSGDNFISRKNHALIGYDFEDNEFWIKAEKNAVWINGKLVRNDVTLARGDVVKLGQSVFIFVPLCSEGFKWSVD